MAELRRLMVPVLAVTVLTTCEEFPEDPTGADTAGPVQVSVVAVDWPQAAAIEAGVALEVEVVDTEGRAIMDPPVRWSLHDTEAASLGGGATATEAAFRGHRLGWARITVQVDDEEGRFTSASMTDSILVLLAGVRIATPAADTSLASIGDTVVVRAVGVDADGGSIPFATIQWEQRGTGALTPVDVSGATARLRAVAAGRDTAVARAPGMCPGGVCAARRAIGVDPVPVAAAVTPDTLVVEIDSTAQLSATAFDARGTPVADASFAWGSDNTAVATVSAAGVVTGVAEGQTRINATVSGSAVSAGSEVAVIRGRGAVSGTVYRDDDGSGTFDAGADTPLGGALVELIRGTSASGTVTATTTTDLSGAFSFTGAVADDYVVVVTPLPGTTIDPASKQITVVEYQTTTVDFTFTGAVVGPIGDARTAALGDPVAIEGVATSATTGTGTLQDSIFYVQDGTAAIAVLTPSAAFPGGFPAVAIGDSIRVVGTRGEAVNQKAWIVAGSVTGLGTAATDTLDVRAYDIYEFRWPSRLARIRNVVIDSITGTRNALVWASDPEDGGADFPIYLNEATGLDGATTFTVGRAYTITGIITRHYAMYEIKPRMADDIQPGLLPAEDIAAARARTDGEWLSVRGVVTAGTGTFNNAAFYIQDASAGIYVFMPADSFPAGVPTLLRGDSVRLEGQRATWNDEVEILAYTVVGEGQGTVPASRAVTATDINTGLYQGELGHVSEVLVDSITGTASQHIWVSDTRVGGEDLLVYLDGDTGIDPTVFTVGGYYEIRGVVARYLTTYQLKPRDSADIAEIIMPIPITDARAAGIGTELAVTGVLSAGVAEFDPEVMYVQDGTVGIQLFFPAADYPTVPSLGIGDSLRVTGFRDELDGVARINVYDHRSYGSGFPVDTVLVTADQVAAGMWVGQLVRLDGKMATHVQNATWFQMMEPGGDENPTWADPGVGFLTGGIMGVGGTYDVVGVVAEDPVSAVYNTIRPRYDSDVTELEAPGYVWASFLNVPVGIVDSVRNGYFDGGTQQDVVLPTDAYRKHASLKTSSWNWLSWAWAGTVGFDSLTHRSMDVGKGPDGIPAVNVVPCLRYGCANGDGLPRTFYSRWEIMAPEEIYGLYPTAELTGDNDSWQTANPLDYVFFDALAEGVGALYYAHTGTVDETTDPSDFYSVDFEAGDQFTIEVLSDRVEAEGTLDPYLKLYDGAGNLIAQDDDGAGGLDSRIALQVMSTGTYFIEVTIFQGSGVYTLKVVNQK